MDTVRSWLDADEVRRMAEGLMGTTPKGEESPEFSEEQPASPRPSVSKALASARKVAEGSGMLQSSSSPSSLGDLTADSPSNEVMSEREESKFGSSEVSEMPPIKVSDEERESADSQELDPMLFLQLSEQWKGSFALKSMLVIDSDGEVVFDTLSDSKLTQMAQKLAAAAPTTGHLFVRIGAGASLQVIPVSTANGLFVFGILVSQALTSDQVCQLSDQVISTMG